MKIHGHLDLQGNLLKNIRLEAADFPTTPEAGNLFWHQAHRTVYFCVELLSGLPVWVPLATLKTFYRHIQNSAALEWTVPHNLNINPVLIQVYDTDGKWIIPDEILQTELDTATITFSTPTAGVAIAMRGELDGPDPAPIAYTHTQAIAANEWVVNHMLGYNPTVKVYVSGEQVQPSSIVYNTLNQLTITFSGNQAGYARLY